MTTQIQFKKDLTMALLITAISIGGNVFAQNNSPNNALWQANGSDTVQTNRYVKVNNSMRVLGELHIGTGSLTLLGLGFTILY